MIQKVHLTSPKKLLILRIVVVGQGEVLWVSILYTVPTLKLVRSILTSVSLGVVSLIISDLKLYSTYFKIVVFRSYRILILKLNEILIEDSGLSLVTTIISCPVTLNLELALRCTF